MPNRKSGPVAFWLRSDMVATTMVGMDNPQVPRDLEDRESDRVLDSIVGPFYTPASMAAVLGTSLAETMRLIEAEEALGAQLENGAWLCPTWQLTNNTVHPELVVLWRLLLESADPWAALLWICIPNIDLNDQSPLQWTESGKPAEVAEMSAAHTASLWAQ